VSHSTSLTPQSNDPAFKPKFPSIHSSIQPPILSEVTGKYKQPVSHLGKTQHLVVKPGIWGKPQYSHCRYFHVAMIVIQILIKALQNTLYECHLRSLTTLEASDVHRGSPDSLDEGF
jgi:hypothetical protein